VGNDADWAEEKQAQVIENLLATDRRYPANKIPTSRKRREKWGTRVRIQRRYAACSIGGLGHPQL
jgi:hypothetical protein